MHSTNSSPSFNPQVEALLPLRLSHSALDTLQLCERKFQLDRLMISATRDESEHLIFGTAYGIGVADYLTNRDPDRALLACWLAYNPVINYGNKTQETCIAALQSSFPALDTLLDDYALVSFNSKPATELGFRLNVNANAYYVGYIDAVLQHRYTGKFYIFECKHTGLLLEDLTPLYKHSGQALGYSVALDEIVGSKQAAYGVIYFVCQLQREFGVSKVHVIPFEKTLADRFNWFLTLGLDIKHIEEMLSLDVWPRRYQGCLKYNKPCFHFGTCHMHSLDRLKPAEPDTKQYDFTFDLEALIASHIARL